VRPSCERDAETRGVGASRDSRLAHSCHGLTLRARAVRRRSRVSQPRKLGHEVENDALGPVCQQPVVEVEVGGGRSGGEKSVWRHLLLYRLWRRRTRRTEPCGVFLAVTRNSSCVWEPCRQACPRLGAEVHNGAWTRDDKELANVHC